jgi:ribosomal protein L14E/L6E/L27E
MNEFKAEIGSLCYSKSGRDSERYYIITDVLGDDYVMICDGKHRKLNKPKKKKLKHLKLKGQIFESIADKLKNNKQVFDSEIYSALRPFNDNL